MYNIYTGQGTNGIFPIGYHLVQAHCYLCSSLRQRLPYSLNNESPFKTAHAGLEKLWAYLSEQFYWPRMGKDVKNFCTSCDICQKTKHRNFARYGTLIPNPIPGRPYESISMDFIVNLPKSGLFNAIWVVVD